MVACHHGMIRLFLHIASTTYCWQWTSEDDWLLPRQRVEHQRLSSLWQYEAVVRRDHSQAAASAVVHHGRLIRHRVAPFLVACHRIILAMILLIFETSRPCGHVFHAPSSALLSFSPLSPFHSQIFCLGNDWHSITFRAIALLRPLAALLFLLLSLIPRRLLRPSLPTTPLSS